MTQQRESENAVGLSEQSLTHVFEHHVCSAISDSIVGIDTDSRVVLWNRAAALLYQLESERAVGRLLSDIYTYLWDSPELETAAWQSLHDHGVWRGENVHLTHDGRRLKVESSVSSLYSRSGQLEGYLAVIREISQRERLQAEREQALSDVDAERNRLRLILNNLPVAVGLSDASGRVLELNDHVERLWGGSPKPGSIGEYGVYQGWWVDGGEPVRPGEWTTARALASGEPIHGDVIEIQRFDGGRAVILSSAVPLKGADGSLLGVVGITEDITEQRRRIRLSESLNAINVLIHSRLASEDVVSASLEYAGVALDASAVGLVEPSGGDWLVLYGHEHEVVDVGDRLPLDALPAEAEALHTAQTVHAQRSGAADEAMTAAVMAVPLVVRGTVTGVMSFERRGDGEFHEEELEYAIQLGATLSLALDNVRLYGEQRERALLSTALNDIDAMVNESLGFESTLAIVLEKVADVLHAPISAIARREGLEWDFVEVRGMTVPADRGRFPDAELPATLSALAEQRAVAMTQEDPEANSELMKELGIWSLLAIPLVNAGEIFGLLYFGSPEEGHEWSTQQTDFAVQLGAHLSLAAQNAALFEAERERAALEGALNYIDAIIHSAVGFDEVMNRALQLGVTAVEADSGSLALHESGRWVARYEYGMGPDFLGYAFPDEDAGYLPLMHAERLPRVFEHPPESPDVVEGDFGRVSFASNLVTPLVIRDRVFGLMFFNRVSPQSSFTPNHLDFARKLAASVSLALENIRLFEAEQRAARLAEALNRVNELLLSTLDVGEMLETIVAEASEAAGADRSILIRPERDEWVIASIHNVPESQRGRKLPRDYSQAGLEAVRTRQPLFVEDVDTDERVNKTFAEELGWKSFVLLPLYAGDELIALVYFGFAKRSRFDPSMKEFARRISTAITLALENARLFQAERLIAETLQETLLVVPQNIKGIEFRRHYTPATSSARVGGDFIDVFQLSRRRVAVALGDVSGKGLKAASLTAMVRNTMRAHAIDGLPPSMVASKTNNVLRIFTETSTFVTAFFAVLDTRSGRLTYVSAGHPPAIIISPTGGVRVLGGHSPVLGAYADVGYRDYQCVLEEGDCLLAYSDGVDEARGERGMFGQERLLDVLTTLPSVTPENVVISVYRAIEEFTRGHFRDDVALLAVCRNMAAEQQEPPAQAAFGF